MQRGAKTFSTMTLNTPTYKLWLDNSNKAWHQFWKLLFWWVSLCWRERQRRESLLKERGGGSTIDLLVLTSSYLAPFIFPFYLNKEVNLSKPFLSVRVPWTKIPSKNSMYSGRYWPCFQILDCLSKFKYFHLSSHVNIVRSKR